MSNASQETRISAAFVEIADTRVEDFGVVGMLDTLLLKCTQILDANAGGLMLVNASGGLQVVASTTISAPFIPRRCVSAARRSAR